MLNTLTVLTSKMLHARRGKEMKQIAKLQPKRDVLERNPKKPPHVEITKLPCLGTSSHPSYMGHQAAGPELHSTLGN